LKCQRLLSLRTFRSAWDFLNFGVHKFSARHRDWFWKGLQGKRQIASIDRGRKLALTHNLGGAPGECVSFVSVVGSEPSA
jgi:hypothetical protein